MSATPDVKIMRGGAVGSSANTSTATKFIARNQSRYVAHDSRRCVNAHTSEPMMMDFTVAASLNPALVILPNHALVAWQTTPDREEWDYLETTLINSATFEQAADIGRRKAEAFRKQAAAGNPLNFRLRALRALRALRTQFNITPME